MLDRVRSTSGAKYSSMDQVKFEEDSLQKILLGPFLNTLPILQIFYEQNEKERVNGKYKKEKLGRELNLF